MPLFVCDNCKGIDNTACGGTYWSRMFAEDKRILCSECHTGKWKAPFPKRIATKELVDSIGRDNFKYTSGL